MFATYLEHIGINKKGHEGLRYFSKVTYGD